MSLTVTADPPPPPLAADAAVLPGEQPPLTVPSPELGLDTGALADQDGEVGICLLQGYIVLLDEVSGEGRGNDGSPRLSPLGPGKLRAGRYLTLPTHRVRPRSSRPAPTHLTPRLPGELWHRWMRSSRRLRPSPPPMPLTTAAIFSLNLTTTRGRDFDARQSRRPSIAAPANRSARRPAAGQCGRGGGPAGRGGYWERERRCGGVVVSGC